MKAIIPLLLFTTALISAGVSRAQVALQAPRVGVLMPGSARDSDEQRDRRAFLLGFKELGYVPGQNILFEYRGADQKHDSLPQLANDLLRLKVSAIVAVGTAAIDVATKATKTVPIVMVSGGNPVGRGFVKSLSVPGGNVTGLSSVAEGDEGKRVELLKDAFPWVSRVTVLNADKRKTRVASYLREGKGVGVEFEVVHVYSSEELKHALGKITSRRSDAIITVRNAFTIGHAEQIAEFAIKNRLPSIYESREFVEKGGLMSYGVNYTASWRRSAFYVDKILKRANPALLPVEPPQFEFLINLKTADKMGHRIPPEILLEANEVIK